MKNPFRIAPRCVQWAAVILIATQAFNFVVALNVAPLERYLPYGGMLLIGIAIQLAFAIGLLFGMKLVRLLFAATFCYEATTSILTWSQQGLSSMSLVSDLTARFAPGISLVLVLLPAANRYFSDKPKPEPVEEKVGEGSAWGFWPVARIVVLLLLILVGIPLVRHFRPAFENASSRNQEQKAAYAKYQEDLQDLQIVENLRMLGQAQSQFFFEHPGMTAKYSDLVGPDHFIRKMTTSAAGEKYPDEYLPGKEPVATLPDGRIVFFDMETFKAKRTPPR